MARISKKEFVLSQIAPYFNDTTLCGFDEKAELCQYLTAEGKMCVAGKNMLPEVLQREDFKNMAGIDDILDHNEQKDIFKKEAVGRLDTKQWVRLQGIHDNLAMGKDCRQNVERLGLFTYEELEAYAEKLSKKNELNLL